MAVKIAVTPEYEDEKRHFHSNWLLLFLLLKKLNTLSHIFFGSYAPDCSIASIFKMVTLLKGKNFRSQRELILSFKSSSLWFYHIR